MPLIFVHGVNNRASDCDYFRDRGMRTTMFDRLVAQAARGRYSGFAVLDDVYWGDLGVKYLWGLRSVPPTKVLEFLGPAMETLASEETLNTELLELLGEFPPVPSAPTPAPDMEALGIGTSLTNLVSVARQTPSRLIRAIMAPAKVEADPRPAVPGGEPELSPEQQAQCESEGRDRALLLIAADEAARSDEVALKLRSAKDDETLLSIVQQETFSRYQALSPLLTGAAPRPLRAWRS